MFALLGLATQFPLVTTNDNAAGSLTYSAATGALLADSTPVSFQLLPRTQGGRAVPVQAPKDTDLRITLTNQGGVASGTTTPTDLIISGQIDLDNNGSFEYSGVLLTGKVQAFGFGFLDSGGAVDTYEIRLTPTGGALNSPYFSGKDIGIVISSEFSTFSGSFASDFTGNVKASVFPVVPLLSSLSGYVYHDSNNDASRAGEAPIPGTTVNLAGTDDTGAVIGRTATTDSNGFYSFTGLREGVYTVTEVQPLGWNDGKDSVGSLGGIGANDITADITVPAGRNGIEYNFGEVLPVVEPAKSSIAGYVYYDKNDNGIFESGESPISGATVSLSGTDYQGNPVSLTTVTGVDGHYKFENLLEGTYSLIETQPAGYKDGKDTIGTPSTELGGGVTGNDQFTEIYLPPGYDGDNNNFGELKAAALGNYTWEDLNYNGRQDANEPAVDGITATLYSATTNAPVPGVAPQVTDSNGFYKFDDLAPGSYYVVFTTKAGYSRTVTNSGVATDAADSDADATGQTGIYTLVSEEYNDTVDAGYYRPASLGDFVWHDLNANGQQDAGEPGIAGVTVTLSNGATAITDASGYYLFSNLTPGNYSVSFPALAGYVRTGPNAGNDGTDSDADTITGNTGTYTLASGQTDLSVDAGYYQLATLGDFVWHDVNANGQQDAGEAGIKGVVVTLFDANGQVVASQTTPTNGSYLFTNLIPGTYSVGFGTANGYVRTVANAGADASDSDADASTGLTGSYTLASGDVNLTVDAGYYKLASLGDFVWHDLNANGQQDAGEPGIGGVVVTLSNGATTTTNSNGYYLFSNLVPGTYSVTFAGVSGFVRTGANVGSDASDSDANVSSGATGSYTLASGEQNLTVDAGYYKLAELGDFVWNDKNANGVQDAGETGIAGVVVTLNTGATTTTDANGFYLFSNLVPGTYSVTFASISGYVRTTADAGGDDAKDSDANATSGVTGSYTLTSGQSNRTVDAGYYQLASLGDFVWLDANRNGVQDSGEAGVANVPVTLYNAGGSAIGATTTNSSGYYIFSGLTPASYTVGFALLTGYAFTTANVGANDAVDSDVNVVTGRTGIITLVGGQNDLTNDAGIYALTAGIDLEKTTNGPSNSNPTAPDYDNEDTATGAGVPALTPGSSVTWTYKVTNTGETNFTTSQIVIVDDNGTTNITSDDFSTTGGQITFLGVQVGDADNILEPGEVWLYKASSTVQTLSSGFSSSITVDFSGNSALYGTAGNVRTFTAGGVSVKASGFSRDKSTGAWATAFLGSYGGGLGVTDTSEGTGGNNSHTVDNYGRDNAVLLRFSEAINLDSAYLGYVVGDSDLSVWIGNISGAFDASSFALSDAVLMSMGFTQVSDGGSSTRTATLNAGNYVGNVVILASKAGDSDDNFKIDTVSFRKPVTGVYANKATVTVPGDTDSDWSHYKNNALSGTISGTKYKDITGNGLSSDDTGLSGVTINLFQDKNNNGVVDSYDGLPVQSKVTASNGNYSFTGLGAGKYLVQEVVPTGWVRTAPTNTDTYLVNLAAGGTTGGLNFANYDTTDCACGLTNVYFVINGKDIVTDLRGNTDPGDTVQAFFTVRAGYTATLSLVSYTAPQSYFDDNTASQQEIFDLQSGTYGPGTYSMTVLNPSCNYQVDFVCGYAIDQLGPAGSNIFYSAQDRLLSADNDGNGIVCTTGKTSISGFAFVDADNDGIFDTNESPIAGVTVKLYNSSGTTLLDTTTTDANGKYVFANLAPGTYQVWETQPAAYLDGKEQLGSNGGTVSNDKFSNVAVSAGNAGTNYNFGELKGAMIDGIVYEDTNDNGQVDAIEEGIAGVKITLTGTDDLGAAVTKYTTTLADGSYVFKDLRPGTYRVTETQPSGYIDGKDTLGTSGGTVANDVFSNIVLSQDEDGENYNFGERRSTTNTTTLCNGMTATIGYWQNNNGQALILSMNGSASSTALGNWLAVNFPNLYGANSVYRTGGKTNTQVAAIFKTVFKNDKTEAQAMAVAFAIYVTDYDLAGGTQARNYGFKVNTSGTGAATFNVGTAGTALGLNNYGTYSILKILQSVNSKSSGGYVQGTTSIESLINNLLTNVNETGDI